MARVVVIGAGVSGLTCARALQEAGIDVTVVTAQDPIDTVSAVAGAAWYPIRGERGPRTDAWLRASYDRFRAIARDPSAGIVERRALELLRAPADDAWWREVLPGFHHVPPPRGFAGAWAAGPIPVLEMPVYLGWLVRRVRTRARIVRATVRSFADVPAEIIVDCAGLGARALAGDPTMTPILGQVVRVEQVGLDTMVLDEAGPSGITYIIPRARDVVLGGAREEGAEDTAWDADRARAIVGRCVAIEPRLRHARIVSRATGLRPGRPAVRLEAEERDGRLIVHDYGHGGSGVALSWGCALDVVELVTRALGRA